MQVTFANWAKQSVICWMVRVESALKKKSGQVTAGSSQSSAVLYSQATRRWHSAWMALWQAWSSGVEVPASPRKSLAASTAREPPPPPVPLPPLPLAPPFPLTPPLPLTPPFPLTPPVDPCFALEEQAQVRRTEIPATTSARRSQTVIELIVGTELRRW